MAQLGYMLPQLLQAPVFSIKDIIDPRSDELKCVLFREGIRGAVGKLIYTIRTDEKEANIKSVYINRKCRGYGLSRILFYHCVSLIQDLDIECVKLEAEEDVQRHDKLVSMYRSWGFEVVNNAKCSWIYNDEECYRRISMICFLNAMRTSVQPQYLSNFFIISIATSDRKPVVAASNGSVFITENREDKCSFWKTSVSTSGKISLLSVFGKYLCVELNGFICADRKINSTWESFEVLSGTCGILLRTFHGSFLGFSSKSDKLITHQSPVFWGIENGRLICNQLAFRTCTMLLRKHMTYEFQMDLKSQYLQRDKRTLSIDNACRYLAQYHEYASIQGSYLMKKMIYVGNRIRENGHPDWMQLVGFLYPLGLLMMSWIQDDNFCKEFSTEYWLNHLATWITGIPIPNNVDQSDSNVVSTSYMRKYEAGCGLQNVEVVWTPDEYLYQVLIDNKTSIPEEGLQMIRFRSCCLLYKDNCYDYLCSMEDLENIPRIAEFCTFTNPEPSKFGNVIVNDSFPYFVDLCKKYMVYEVEW